MKKSIVAIAGAVLIGSLIPASVVLAADKNVQALFGQSNITINGKQVAANVPKLVYGGTTYVQLYSLEHALKSIGITPTWNGKTFDMGTPSTTSSSGSSSGNTTSSVIKLSNFSKASVAGSTVLEGNAVNTDTTAHSFTISVSYYDSSGNLLGVEVGSVNDLGGGQETSFQTLPTGNYMDATNYKVQVEAVM